MLAEITLGIENANTKNISVKGRQFYLNYLTSAEALYRAVGHEK
jgi:hypothetical protein